MRGPVRALLWLGPLAAGALALALGQDASWDLRNYHFYGPHAWLNGRLGFDVAVAHAATFYNPTLHLPFHWAVVNLEPRVVGVLLGALAGCNLWCLLGIGRRLDAASGREPRAGVVVPLALAGLLGAMFVSELGTSFGDNLLSIPVLAAVAWAMRDLARLHDGPGRPQLVLGPALLCGAAAGLKLPFAVYGVALAAALLVVPRTTRGRIEVLLACGGAGLAGALLTGGWWALQMARRYGSPVFPYFNDWFGSPWAGTASYRDPRFLAEGVAESLAFPFRFALAPHCVAEVGFFDLRFPLLYVLLLALLLRIVLRAARGPGTDRRGDDGPARAELADRFLLVFVVVAFAAWMAMFGVARYLVVAELLAPMAAWAAWRRLSTVRPPGVAVAVALLAVLGMTGRPAQWDRRAWSGDYFDVVLPSIEDPAHTLLLMAGNEPSAYMIPYLPRTVRAMRIEGYFTGPSPRANATDRLMRELVERHRGPILFLFRSYERPRAARAAAAYGLRIAMHDCEPFLPGIEPDRRHPYLLCGSDRPRP